MSESGGEALRKAKETSSPIINAGLEKRGDGSETRLREVKIYCFSLNHSIPQGLELEALVKEKAPNTSLKVRILSEQDPSLGYDSFPQLQKSAMSQMKATFEELEKYYGDENIVVYSDNSNLVALNKACEIAWKKWMEKAFDRNELDQQPQEKRAVYSLAASLLYVKASSDFYRSMTMINDALKIASSDPNTIIFLVAGSSHIDDAVSFAALSKEKRDAQAFLEPVRLNEVGDNALAPYIRELLEYVGDYPFEKLAKRYQDVIKSLANSETARKWTAEAFNDFVTKELGEIAGYIDNSGVSTSTLAGMLSAWRRESQSQQI